MEDVRLLGWGSDAAEVVLVLEFDLAIRSVLDWSNGHVHELDDLGKVLLLESGGEIFLPGW